MAFMGTRHRVLIAAQAPVSALLQDMLQDAAELVPVDTQARAFALLAREAGRIGLIVCTLGFDESRMVEFLQAAKGNPRTSGIPFLVVRVIRRFLSDELVARLAPVARQCGAADFLDLAGLDEQAARATLRAAAGKFLAH